MRAVIQKKITLLPTENIIRMVRGQKIILDIDLADLYGVKPTALRQQVKRNLERFPPDFMFRLSKKEAGSLVSQFVIPNKNFLGGSTPYAFTQEGVAMLSSVLRSTRAIEMNILIMRAFVRLRQLVATNKDLALRIEKLEHDQTQATSIMEIILEDIDKLGKEIRWIKNPPLKPKYPIGFVGREAKE